MSLNSNNPEKMTNHQKTEVGKALLGNYNFLENVLSNLGLEVVIVSMRAKAAGYSVDQVNMITSAEERKAYKNVSLEGSGVDWD